MHWIVTAEYPRDEQVRKAWDFEAPTAACALVMAVDTYAWFWASQKYGEPCRVTVEAAEVVQVEVEAND